MAGKKTNRSPEFFSPQDPIYLEVSKHYLSWTEDNEKRRSRPNGWDAVTDAYWGRLPNDWPYDSKVVDPRIRTSLIEKKGRILNSKLQGRLVPRPDSDQANVIRARINNALLDFQWDNANEGGTMLSKWGQMDQDTRMYASDFGLVKWKHEEDKDGKVIFDGNEFYPLDVRNCGADMQGEHVRNMKWFQVREWAKIEDMEQVNDLPNGKQIYPGLTNLKAALQYNASDRRSTAYPNRILQIKSLVDRVGEDRSYPVIEVVTEYRKDRWITFAPRYKVVLRDIPNPYKHGRIPVVQLRYYKVTGDPWGESEVEPVLPMWKAIQAILCGFLDNMNIHNRPPLKIIDGQVRIESIIFGPEAQWLMDQENSVTEFEGSTTSIEYFQQAYQAAVSAFDDAMGDLSQGVSQVQPTKQNGSPTTATEINYTAKQQNIRDQDNQTQLAEALEDMMQMWLSNNQQFIFASPDAERYLLKIVDSNIYNYFKRVGMDQTTLSPEATRTIGDIIMQRKGDVSQEDISQMVQAGQTPAYPVVENPKEKRMAKIKSTPKLSMNGMNDEATLILEPEDLEGVYSYVADVKSMSVGAGMEIQQARDNFLNRLTTNPIVIQLLQQQGVTPDIKELLIADAQGSGLDDAERYFPQSNTITQGQGQPIQGQPQNSQLPPGQASQPALGQVAPSANVPNITLGMQTPQMQGNNMV